MKKEQEIQELKSKIAEVMAVMPPGAYPGSSPPASSILSTPRYFCNVEDPPVSTVAQSAASVSGGGGATPNSGSDGGNGGGSGGGASSASSGSPVPTPEPQQQGQTWDQGKSVLDPNAACYRPKSN